MKDHVVILAMMEDPLEFAEQLYTGALFLVLAATAFLCLVVCLWKRYFLTMVVFLVLAVTIWFFEVFCELPVSQSRLLFGVCTLGLLIRASRKRARTAKSEGIVDV